MIKYVIWDFNGTILDDRELTLNLLNTMLIKQNKKPLKLKKYLDVFGFPIKDYYIKAGISFEEESFEEMALWFIKEYQPLSLKESLMPNVTKTLKAINDLGIKNICLSASRIDNLTEQLNHFNISKYFEAILGIDNIHALGKDEVGRNYLKLKGIDPKTCLYVGDTTEDYRIASLLNVKSVLFTGGHQSKKRLKIVTNLIIDDLYDILKLVK